jgi:hypothetical protein
MNNNDPKLFLWRDHWFGVYRKGFTAVLQADREVRRTAKIRTSVVYISLLLILMFWFFGLPPENPGWPAYERSIQLRSEGNLTGAIAAIKEAIKTSPDCLRYRLRLAWLGVLTDRPDLIADAFWGMITVSPTFLGFLILVLFALYYGGVIFALYAQSKSRRRFPPPAP